MEEAQENTKADVKPTYSVRKLVRNSFILLLAVTVGFVHYKYVSTLFENDTNFSHLSELEREMSLRTEMGFYYSYYKTMVEERPFIAGITKMMYDRLVEFPKEVNAFNRFNIHPEVIVGALYRHFEPYLNTSAHRQCHMVDRGPDLSPVESCVGLGQPVLFYLQAVWALAGLLMAVIFLQAVVLSDTLLGGVLAVAQYFANHAEGTRVQWAPNERENFAAPLLFLQTFLLTIQLRDKTRATSFQLQVSIFILNCLCLLFWQFTQFIFLTQTAIFFVMEQLRIIEVKTLCVFLHSHFCGLHMAVLLLQGNDMLNTSLYASFFFVVSAYCLFFSNLRIKVKNRKDLLLESWLVFLRISIVICASLYLKQILSDLLQVQDDAHIWDILFSKFTDYKTFHTLIYTCSAVFDFLPLSSVYNMMKTLLIPLVILGSVNVTSHWIGNSLNDVKAYYDKEMEKLLEDARKEDDANDSGIENTEVVKKVRDVRKDLDDTDKDAKPREVIEDSVICFVKHLKVDPAVFYNISQMVVFGAMAALVMRLKLLFVTQMCVVSSLAMSAKYYTRPKSRWVPILWVICASSLVRRLVDNVSVEMSYVGEFTDIQQEQMLQWISSDTSPGEAFAGSMPVLATVMLATRRPIVAHPHYEHLEARQRAYAVYKVYGKFSPQELYEELTKLKASYLIVEAKYCYGRSTHFNGGKGCSFEDIWDIEHPSLSSRPKLCHTLLTETTDHFYRVFWNDHYSVYRVHDFSVRYTPRCFNT